MASLCEGHSHLERLLSIFDRSGVESRFVVHPSAWYLDDRTFEERNREYIHHGLELAEEAVRECLGRAAISPAEIDYVFFVTTTGLATPSLDALLAQRLGLSTSVRRFPLFGLGCAGGAGAIARADDLLRHSSGTRALVVSVELCSLVFSTKALTATDLVGVALFGDGAAAVLLGGDDTATSGVRVVKTQTRLFPEAEHLMGWNFTGDGMRLVLSRDIPRFVAERVAPVVDEFARGLGPSDSHTSHYILHPGGPKVMATYRSALGLPESALRVARHSMRRFGNLSSASVLFMLTDVIDNESPAAGDTGLMLALGPGFAAEMVALAW